MRTEAVMEAACSASRRPPGENPRTPAVLARRSATHVDAAVCCRPWCFCFFFFCFFFCYLGLFTPYCWSVDHGVLILFVLRLTSATIVVPKSTAIVYPGRTTTTTTTTTQASINGVLIMCIACVPRISLGEHQGLILVRKRYIPAAVSPLQNMRPDNDGINPVHRLQSNAATSSLLLLFQRGNTSHGNPSIRSPGEVRRGSSNTRYGARIAAPLACFALFDNRVLIFVCSNNNLL